MEHGQELSHNVKVLDSLITCNGHKLSHSVKVVTEIYNIEIGARLLKGIGSVHKH